MFDIHKVKPIHGWREFFGEVGIIVLGVLIALAAEAVIERLHWHEQIAGGREALKADAEAFVGVSAEREAVSGCLARRFADIADIIDAASRTGRLPPVGSIGNPPAREWRFASWDSLVAAQVTTHMRHEELETLAGIVENGVYADQLNRDEFNDWSILFTIVGPGRRFNLGEEAPLRQALSRAVYDAKLVRIIGFQNGEYIRNSGLLTAAEYRVALANRPTGDSMALCHPIGPAPSRYGQSPFKYDLDKPADQE